MFMSKLIVAFICSFIMFAAESIAQIPVPTKGTIVRHEMFASSFVDARNIDVWLPENYDVNKKYAVLYMHDGQMLYDAAITWNNQEWQVDEIVGQLLSQNQIIDCIVVGIWNNGVYRHSEYFPQTPISYLSKDVQDTLIKNELQQQPRSDAYLKFVVTELKPFIDKTYSTYTDKNHTMIAGSSMGGLISMYAICEYPEVFGGAACLSTHWPGSLQAPENVIPQAFQDYLSKHLPSPDSHKIYFDFGTTTLDQLYEPHQIKVDSRMVEKGFTEKNWITRKFEGEPHTEEAWSKRLHIPLTFLLGQE